MGLWELERSSQRVLRRWLQDPGRAWSISELCADRTLEQQGPAENMIGWMAQAGWARCFWDPPQDLPRRPRRRYAQLTESGVSGAQSLLAASRPEGVLGALFREGWGSARLAWNERRQRRGHRGGLTETSRAGGADPMGSIAGYSDAGVWVTLRRDGVAAAYLAWKQRRQRTTNRYDPWGR